MELGKYISLREVVHSNTATRRGIDNTPSKEQEKVIEILISDFFTPLRETICLPIKVNSFYRSEELNKAIGGSKRSDHMIKGDVAAIDIDDTYSKRSGITNRDIFLYIYTHMDYNKLIWEKDETDINGKKSCRWIHISYSTDQEKNKERTTLYYDGVNYQHFKVEMI